MDMIKDPDLLMRKRKTIRRQILERQGMTYLEKRIAILGGSTTADIKDILEIFLLYAGIKPTFYESEYGKYYEDAVFGNQELDTFQPDIIIIWTSFVNLQFLPKLQDTMDEVQKKIKTEYNHYEHMWESLKTRYGAVVIQNNIELPYMRQLGSLDASLPQGLRHYVEKLNEYFSTYAQEHSSFYIHDLHYLAASIGLSRFHNRAQYYAYKFAINYDVVPFVASSLAHLLGAVLGRSKKCLILDLDNTLWGGVIGDDGLENIKLGHETPEGEAYVEFQHYVLALKERGVILAVCSKNEEDIAKSGFSHPDSVLAVEDFVAFHANWEPKDVNIRAIAKEINIGLDSIVFIDDNPAERAIVRQSLPEVAVPEVDAQDIFSYIRAIEENGYFESASLSADDFHRNETYMANKARAQLECQSGSYDEYLQSLEMEAEIAPFVSIYFDRISQLTGKTNQFNLTTRRYTRADIERMATDEKYVTLYGRLKDCFGDNGLIAVTIAEQEGADLHIILWLMSCRVLKRGMEQVMLDALVAEAKRRNIKDIYGYYYPTKKNKMVAELYGSFGFEELSSSKGDNAEEDCTMWHLKVDEYLPQGKFIEVRGSQV